MVEKVVKLQFSTQLIFSPQHQFHLLTQVYIADEYYHCKKTAKKTVLDTKSSSIQAMSVNINSITYENVRKVMFRLKAL